MGGRQNKPFSVKRLQEVIKQRGFNQSTLSEKMNFPRVTINRALKSGVISTETLDIICRFLDVSKRYICGENLPDDLNAGILGEHDSENCFIPSYSQDFLYDSENNRKQLQEENQLFTDLLFMYVEKKCIISSSDGDTFHPVKSRIIEHAPSFETDVINFITDYLIEHGINDLSPEYKAWLEKKEGGKHGTH